ncbi:hypothetical protein AAFF_G00349050 [Aldrovandia affinis]|uniref:C-type lectin domain-containing protein n=1 Tax=Aldrovandia affinis TaxID=143900 RepID=A0AAD7SJ46_9TELE|nr:hypothetical protein AAFF_G00349050 [Aldrovandia affinis]
MLLARAHSAADEHAADESTITDGVGQHFLRACPEMRSIISIALFLMIGMGVSSAQNVVLNGTVGQIVAFPDAVKKSGTLIHEHEPIGDVKRGQFRDFREGRVQWNSTTGLFSIAGLKMEDSGMYTLLNNDAERYKDHKYQLNVDDTIALQLQRDYDSLNKAKDQLQRDYDSLNKEKDQLQRDYDSLNTQNNQLQRDYDAVRVKFPFLDQYCPLRSQKRVCRPCPEGWELSNSKCYYFSTERKSWTASRSDCLKQGADLVIIESEEEQDLISKHTRGGYSYWIGLSDSETEGTWLWVDGTPLQG